MEYFYLYWCFMRCMTHLLARSSTILQSFTTDHIDMKNYLTYIFLFVSFALSAQGVNFINNDMAAAKLQAQQSGKPIHVYAYTTWCGPCKVMKKNVFPDAQVGAFYNKSFVNVMLDMENGDGPAVGKKYGVRAYPSFLFLDANGEVVHRSLGGQSTVDFLDLGNAAVDPDRQVGTLRKRYEAGDREPQFLKNLAMAVSKAEYTGFEPYSIEYLNTQKDWSTEENMKFLFDYSEASTNSPLFQYTIKNKDAFVALLGAKKVDQKIAFAAEVDRQNNQINPEDVAALTQHYSKYFSKEKAKSQAKKTNIEYLMYSDDRTLHRKFLAESQLYMATDPDEGWNFYNAVAWEVHLLTDDKHILKQAANWALTSISKESNSFNNDTLAAILYKLGDYNSARLYAETSIKLAEETGADASDTKQLLKKINAK